jgi:uncharacterized membrane protein YkvA (DUF1232 family)
MKRNKQLNIQSYGRYFSEKRFWSKIKQLSRKAGFQVVYAALLLYYLMESRSVPIKAKAGIVAALGYFVLPADLIPDIAVVIGFTDDFAVLLYALSQLTDYIGDEVKEKAKRKLSTWFGDVDEQDLKLLEEKITQIDK